MVFHGLVVELAPGCEFRDAVALEVGPQLADLVELSLETHAVALVVMLKLLMDHGDLLIDFGVYTVQVAHLGLELLSTARGLLLQGEVGGQLVYFGYLALVALRRRVEGFVENAVFGLRNEAFFRVLH